MLDESSFDFSSSLTSELRFCRLHATRLHPFTSLPPSLSNHSAGSSCCIEEGACMYRDGVEEADGLSLEVVLVLRSDDFPWSVSRIAVIGANERAYSPPPAPRAVAPLLTRLEVGGGEAAMMRA